MRLSDRPVSAWGSIDSTTIPNTHPAYSPWSKIPFDQKNFQEYPGPSQRVKKTLKVEKQSVSLKENGIQLNLTVIDTPGFGDSVSIARPWTRSSSGP